MGGTLAGVVRVVRCELGPGKKLEWASGAVGEREYEGDEGGVESEEVGAVEERLSE
jgi:hypothetical protein